MLYLIGLGLSDAKDVTLAGLEIIKKSDKVYLEHYTSILTVPKESLEEVYGRKVEILDRYNLENHCDELIKQAELLDVSILIVGDPLGATTHTDILFRAVKLNIKYRIIHNASIYNAISCCGLQLYSFAQTISIPFFTNNWKPTSFYEKILENSGSHTLCLLDIKVKEISDENLIKGIHRFEPPRFMTVNTAIQQLLEAEQICRKQLISNKSLAVGVARIGAADQIIKVGSLEELQKQDFGDYLHSLVLVGKKVHILEIEFLSQFAVNMDTFRTIAKDAYGLEI